MDIVLSYDGRAVVDGWNIHLDGDDKILLDVSHTTLRFESFDNYDTS